MLFRSGILTAVVLAVTSALHDMSVVWFIEKSNMKYLNDKNLSFILNKMAFEFINLNLPIVYALVKTDETMQNVKSGFLYD